MGVTMKIKFTLLNVLTCSFMLIPLVVAYFHTGSTDEQIRLFHRMALIEFILGGALWLAMRPVKFHHRFFLAAEYQKPIRRWALATRWAIDVFGGFGSVLLIVGGVNLGAFILAPAMALGDDEGFTRPLFAIALLCLTTGAWLRAIAKLFPWDFPGRI